MIPEVHACSGYLVMTAPNGASRQRRSPAHDPEVQALSGQVLQCLRHCVRRMA
jgi:hypothetical protein